MPTMKKLAASTRRVTQGIQVQQVPSPADQGGKLEATRWPGSTFLPGEKAIVEGK